MHSLSSLFHSYITALALSNQLKMAPLCKYTVQAIEMAVGAVNEGMSLRKAARTHGVPVTTLKRKIRNPSARTKKRDELPT